MSPEEARLARMFLLRATEAPAPAVYEFVSVHGPGEAVERIRRGAAPQAVHAEIVRPDTTTDDDLRVLDMGAVRLVTPEDDEWPPGCATASSGVTPPLALWARGSASLADLLKSSVTITGNRAASDYGVHVARDLAGGFAAAGVTVVTGGGFGIDDSASWSALRVKTGRVLVVQPCGSVCRIRTNRPDCMTPSKAFPTVIDNVTLLTCGFT